MTALEPLIIIAGAILIALGSSAITAAFYRARLRRISNESWNRARLFYARSAAQRVIR